MIIVKRPLYLPTLFSPTFENSMMSSCMFVRLPLSNSILPDMPLNFICNKIVLRFSLLYMRRAGNWIRHVFSNNFAGFTRKTSKNRFKIELHVMQLS